MHGGRNIVVCTSAISKSVGGRKAGGKWPSAKECATQREFGLKKMILGDLIRIPDRLPATAPVCVGGVVG